MRWTIPAGLWAALVCGLGCTEVVQNFPEGGCAKDELRCIGGNLYKCNEKQTEFVLVKECAEGSTCGGLPPDCEGKAPVSTGCEVDNACVGRLGTLPPCYIERCVDGTCQVRPAADGAPCDDASACTEADQCTAGVCAGTPVDCDDGNPCTEDHGDPCTEGDACQIGECVGQPACTCGDDADCAVYETDPCKGQYRCIDGYCKTDVTTAFVCDQAGLGPCQVNRCKLDDLGQPYCEVEQRPTGSPCTDGNFCTVEDTCTKGECQGTVDVTIPGCGFFQVRWYAVSAETAWMTDGESVRLLGVVGRPQFFGTAQNDQYRVRAVRGGP